MPSAAAQGTWRIIYRLDPDAVIIGEVFAKKTAKTPKKVKGRRHLQATIQAIRRGNEMKASKRGKLEAAGWKVGSASDFLQLSEAEEALIAMKLALAENLKERRKKRKLTQVQLGKRLGTSQSRVAKMEAADKSVSVDLLVRSLLSVGASREEIGAVVGARVVDKETPRRAKKKLVKS